MAKSLTNLNKSKKDIISDEIYNHELSGRIEQLSQTLKNLSDMTKTIAVVC